MTIFKKIILITITSIFFIGSALAQGHEQSPLKKLDLTPKQLNQISKIRQDSPVHMRSLMSKLHHLKKEFQTMLSSIMTAPQLLKNKFNEVKTLERKIAQVKFDRMLKIRAILTPLQIKKASYLFIQTSSNKKRQHRKYKERSKHE